MTAFDCTGRTHVGHKRKLNEDALLNSPEHCLWAVADGMGGHDAGEVASAMVIEALVDLSQGTSFLNRKGKAIGALETVNAALIELAASAGNDRVIGTTVVGLIADADEFCCFWVGDSRAYRVRADEIVQLTRDHSLVQDLVEAGMLEAERAQDHPNANVLTRAVGAAPALRVDTVDGTLRSGDVFLLASDGLTRTVRDDEIQRCLATLDIEQAADRLIEMALQRGAPDNVTLVIVRVR